MPFTYSITNGIGAGFVSYALLKATQGRAREVHPLLWVVAALFVVYFAHRPDRGGARRLTPAPGQARPGMVSLRTSCTR